MKGGEGSQGGKKKREGETRKAANDITVFICIGAGIKPPRQRAPFTLACGAAAAASGGTEHHRAATPVGPAAPPGHPPGSLSTGSMNLAPHSGGGTAGRAGRGGFCPGGVGGKQAGREGAIVCVGVLSEGALLQGGGVRGARRLCCRHGAIFFN